MELINELRRRNVLRVAAAYLVSAWLIIQVVATIAPAFDLDAWILRTVVIALTIGFIPALFLCAAGITATYEGWYGIDYHDGVVAWLTGDRQESLRLLAQAVEDGFSLPPSSAYNRARYDDPQFAQILERQDEIRMRERHKVLAVVCNDNPYDDVWQPLASTCRDYALETAGGIE